MIGLHFMLDGVMREPVTRELMDSILHELPGRIGMKILAGPVVVAGHSTNPGGQASLSLTKSHIAIRTFTEGRSNNIDVYSCQPL